MLVKEALAVMDSTWQCWDAAEIHRVHGTVLRAMHEDAAAEAAFRHSLDIARRQGAMLWQLRATRDLAALLTERGANDEGRRLLDGLASSDRPRAPGDVQRAREILATAV